MSERHQRWAKIFFLEIYTSNSLASAHQIFANTHSSFSLPDITLFLQFYPMSYSRMFSGWSFAFLLPLFLTNYQITHVSAVRSNFCPRFENTKVLPILTMFFFVLCISHVNRPPIQYTLFQGQSPRWVPRPVNIDGRPLDLEQSSYTGPVRCAIPGHIWGSTSASYVDARSADNAVSSTEDRTSDTSKHLS